MIYILRDPDAPDQVKIGYTKHRNVERRVEDMRTGNPDLVVVASFAGSMADEKKIHEYFARERIWPNREWFKLSPRLKGWIGNKVREANGGEARPVPRVRGYEKSLPAFMRLTAAAIVAYNALRKERSRPTVITRKWTSADEWIDMNLTDWR